MPRTSISKIKLDIEKLERRDTKLLRRLDNLKREIGKGRYIADQLKKILIEKTQAETPVVKEA